MFSLFYGVAEVVIIQQEDLATNEIWYFKKLIASFYIVGYLLEPIIEIWQKHILLKFKNLAYLCNFFLLKSIVWVKVYFPRLQKFHLERSLEGWSLHELDEFNYYLVNASKGNESKCDWLITTNCLGVSENCKRY